jgi:hypothetical protein
MHSLKVCIDPKIVRRPITRTSILENKEEVETSPKIINSTTKR